MGLKEKADTSITRGLIPSLHKDRNNRCFLQKAVIGHIITTLPTTTA